MGQKYLHLLQQEIFTWVYTQLWKMWFNVFNSELSKVLGGYYLEQDFWYLKIPKHIVSL